MLVLYGCEQLESLVSALYHSGNGQVKRFSNMAHFLDGILLGDSGSMNCQDQRKEK